MSGKEYLGNLLGISSNTKSRNIRPLELDEFERPSTSSTFIESNDLDKVTIDNTKERDASYINSNNDISDEKNVNELIQSDNELIEISQNLNESKLSEEYLNVLNESYGKIQKSIIISLTVHDGCALLWKIKNIEKFLQLNLIYEIESVEEICELAKEFIKKSIKEDRLGLSENLIKDDLWMQIKTLDITQLADSRGYNLLMFAAEVNAANLIEQLLKIGFTVNDRAKKIFSADVAWENKNYEIISILLNNNSRFPSKIHEFSGELDEFPASLNNFLSFSKEFYNAFDAGNEEKLTELIEKNLNFRHFFNAFNMSAPLYALYTKNLHLYEFFTAKDVTFGPFDSTKQVIKSLSTSEREKLDKIHKKYAKILPEQHINVMIANTNLGHDIDKLDEKRSYVEKAFYHLNSIAVIQIILKCVAASKKFNIILDFNRSHVQILNPTEEANSNGLFDHSIGRISIAAKQMLDLTTKNDVFGVIAHELCHYAMHLVYRNNCKPYHKGDKASEKKFEKISIMCMRRGKREKFIDMVFEGYHEFFWHAELIVRVPHLTALYHDQPEKLEQTRRNFKPLFDYYEEKVVKDIKKALPTIGMREEEKKRKRKKEKWILRIFVTFLIVLSMIGVKIGYNIYQSTILNNYKWEKLSDSQKGKILTSNFNFQGQNVTINGLIGDNNNNLKLIPPEIFKDFFDNDKLIEIDKVNVANNFYIDRKFVKINENDTIDFNDLKNISFKSFILADESGTGKSTTFNDFALKLKNNFPKRWVSHVNFTDCVRAFEESDKIEFLDEFLSVKILKLNEFNRIVFKTLFNQGKSIILWDGFDEISPKYEKVASNLLAKINSETSNVQFISTRSLYADTLEEILDIKAYKFVPFSQDDRDEFIISYAENDKFTIRESIKSQSFFEKFLRKVRENDETVDVNNPLMLKIFLKTFREIVRKDPKATSINFYSLYDEYVKLNYRSYYQKFKDNKDYPLSEEGSNRVHQALSLKSIFQYTGFTDIQTNKTNNVSSFDILTNIDNTDIIKLSQIGMINIESNEAKFSHRTFAEFFTAQYLIDKFFNDKIKPHTDESILRLKLLFFIIHNNNFRIVHQFLNDYINEIQTKSKMVHFPSKIYLEHIESHFKHVFDYNFLADESLTFVDRLSNFFKNDDKMLNSFWRLNDSETFFIWHFRESSSDDFKIAHEIAQKYFPNRNDQIKLFYGENQAGNIIFNLWHEKNKVMWKEFYSQIFKNDTRQKRLESLEFKDFFDDSLNDTTDLKNMLFTNSLEILYLMHSNPTFFEKIWDQINIALDQVDQKKFLMGIDWKRNETIFHAIITREKLKSIRQISDFIEANLNASQMKQMIFWQNRDGETSFMQVSEFQNKLFMRDFWNSSSSYLDAESIRNLLILKNSQNISSLIISLRNEHVDVFLYVKSIYEFYLTDDEIRNHFEDNSLSILLNENSKINEENFKIFVEFLRKIIINPHNLRRLFATDDAAFIDIFKTFDGNSKISPLISLLLEALTSDEKEEFLNEVKSKIEKIIDDGPHFKHLSYQQRIEALNNIENFFTRKLNIFNATQIDLYKTFENDEFFHFMVSNVSQDCQKACSERQNATENCNQTCPQLKSVDSIIETSLALQFSSVGFSKISFEAQYAAVKIKFKEIFDTAASFKYTLSPFMSALIKTNKNDVYSFLYAPFEDFFVAKFFVENQNHVFLYEENLIPKQIEALIDLWSLKCDCKGVSNLITNYIENDNKQYSFDDDFKNLILSNHSNLLLDINLRMIESASMFLKKDKDILRNLWKVDDNETLYYHFIDNFRESEFEYIEIVARKFFNDTDMKRISSIDGHKGKILFRFWKYRNSQNVTRFNYESLMRKLNINLKKFSYEKLRESENSALFFNMLNYDLFDGELKQFIMGDSLNFFYRDLVELNLNDCNIAWDKISDLFSIEELNKIFNITTDDSETILHKMANIQFEQVLSLYINKLTQILTKAQYTDMLKTNDEKHTPLMKLIRVSSYDCIEIFWNVTEAFLNDSQKFKEILSIKNKYDGKTVLENSFFRNEQIFTFVSNLYECLFTQYELEDIILNEKDHVFRSFIDSEIFPSVFKFVLKIFDSNKNKLLKYLSRDYYNRKSNIFQTQKHGYYMKYFTSKYTKDNMKILTTFVKENSEPDEWKALSIE